MVGVILESNGTGYIAKHLTELQEQRRSAEDALLSLILFTLGEKSRTLVHLLELTMAGLRSLRELVRPLLVDVLVDGLESGHGAV